MQSIWEVDDTVRLVSVVSAPVSHGDLQRDVFIRGSYDRNTVLPEDIKPPEERESHI